MASTAGRVALITAWVVVLGGVAAGAGYLHSLGPPDAAPVMEGVQGAPSPGDGAEVAPEPPALPQLQPPPAHEQAPPADAAEQAAPPPSHEAPQPAQHATAEPEHAAAAEPAPEHADATGPPSLPQLTPPPHADAAERPEPPPGGAAAPTAADSPPALTPPPVIVDPAPPAEAPEAVPEAPVEMVEADGSPATAEDGVRWPVTAPGLHGPMPMVAQSPFDLAQPARTAPPRGAPDAEAPVSPAAEAASTPSDAPMAEPAHTELVPETSEHAEPGHETADGNAPEPAAPAEPEQAPDPAAPERAETPDAHGDRPAQPPDEAPHEAPHEAPTVVATAEPMPEHEAPAPVAPAVEPADAAIPEPAPEHVAVTAPEAPAPVVVPDGPKIAIVIGGLGLTSGATEAAIQSLPGAVTLSFSPYSGRLADWVARARAAGHEVLLDLPMEPADFPRSDPGPQALMTALSAEENLSRLDWVLSRSDAIVGLASYMGSRFAADAQAMEPVLQAIRARGLVYVDTGQAASNVAATVGGQVGVPVLVSDMQVDRMAARQTIDDTLAQVETLAQRDGSAVAVGTAYPVTIERISAWSRSLGDRGIALVPVSALTR